MTFLLAAVFFFFANGALGPVRAAHASAACRNGRSTVEGAEFLGRWDAARLDTIVNGLTDLPVFMDGTTTTPSLYVGRLRNATNSVDLYRITYRSVVPELNNHPVVASGLLAVPVVSYQNPLPVVVYLHGTVFSSIDVPSFIESPNSYEDRLPVSQFAGRGYVVVMADNFGLGSAATKEFPHGFLTKESLQQANYDMLIASRQLLSSKGISTGKTFLSGWSAGSFATAVFLERLQFLNYTVTAVGTAASPLDLTVLVQRIFNKHQARDAVWLNGIVALLINSHSFYYRFPGLATEAFIPSLVGPSQDFYTGATNFSQFLTTATSATNSSVLSDGAGKMMNPAFLSAAGPYWDFLRSLESYRFKSLAPWRLYHGAEDEAVSPEFAPVFATIQQLMGAPVTAVNVDASADHRGTFVLGIMDQTTWFDSLL